MSTQATFLDLHLMLLGKGEDLVEVKKIKRKLVDTCHSLDEALHVNGDLAS